MQPSSASAVNTNTPGALASYKIAAATTLATAARGHPGGRRHQGKVGSGVAESVVMSGSSL